MFTNRETEYTQEERVCIPHSWLSCHFSVQVGEQLCEQAAQVKRPVPSECTGDNTLNEKDPLLAQDKCVCMYVAHSLLGTKNKTHYSIQGQGKFPEVWDKNIHQVNARSSKPVPVTRPDHL